MNPLNLNLVVPEALIADFASDPLSQYNKLLLCSDDNSWPLHKELNRFLNDLPESAIEMAYSDENFLALYGRDERMARIRFTEELMCDEVSRRRLRRLAQPDAGTLPYSHPALGSTSVDDEDMVRLSEFNYNGSCLTINGFSFVTCLTNRNFNSTYWLQEACYKQRVANHISVRLDPFLWGNSDTFPQMFYKMWVYAKPLNWEGIGRLKQPLHGQMRHNKSWDGTELTEFCWTPREDGIHFVCEELPPKDRIDVRASRYLHAVYDPSRSKIIHFDGALRIYTDKEIEDRLQVHVRKAGKAGLRRKVFRTDHPIDREAFSLIAQAFFIWNEDLATYFREILSRDA